MYSNYVNDMRKSINSYPVVFKEIIESAMSVAYKIYQSNKEKDKYLVSVYNTYTKDNEILKYSLLINDVMKLKKLSYSYRKKDLHNKLIFSLLEKELEIINSTANNNIYNNDTCLNVVDSFEGKLIDIHGNKCCININNQDIIFPLEREEGNNCGIYLNKPVRIYAEVKKDMDGEIIEGIEIFKLESIEILDKEKVEKDFYDLMKKLNINNLTQIIIDMRHKDE